jgi:hypothetical protein
VIYNEKEKVYLRSKNGLRWVEKLYEAENFATLEAAEKSIKNSYGAWLKNQNASVTIEAYEDSELTYGIETYEQAEEIFNKIYDAGNVLGAELPKIKELLKVYEVTCSQLDGAQQDLLHRIEFGNITGLAGLRLIKKLKDIRIKRRKVKDAHFYLTMISETTDKYASCLEKYNNQMRARTYIPRIMPELFNEKGEN